MMARRVDEFAARRTTEAAYTGARRKGRSLVLGINEVDRLDKKTSPGVGPSSGWEIKPSFRVYWFHGCLALKGCAGNDGRLYGVLETIIIEKLCL